MLDRSGEQRPRVGRGAVLYDIRDPERRPCCSRGGRCLAHVTAVYQDTYSGSYLYEIEDGTHTTHQYVHGADLWYMFEPAGWSTTQKPTYILTRCHGVEDHHDKMQEAKP